MKKIILMILYIFILSITSYSLAPTSTPNKLYKILNNRTSFWLEYFSNDISLGILEPILSPKILDRDNLKQISDFGGYSNIYYDPNNTKCFYKITKNKNPDSRIQFNLVNLNEAKILLILNKLNVTHIPTINEIGINLDGSIWYNMEGILNLEQLSLHSKYWTVLTKDQKIDLLIKIAEVYHSIHKHGYIHGDIKPPNILINNNDFLIIDFGTSRRVSSKDNIEIDLLWFSTFILEQFLSGFNFINIKTGFEKNEIIESGIKSLIVELQDKKYRKQIDMRYIINKLNTAKKYFIDKTLKIEIMSQNLINSST